MNSTVKRIRARVCFEENNKAKKKSDLCIANVFIASTSFLIQNNNSRIWTQKNPERETKRAVFG